MGIVEWGVLQWGMLQWGMLQWGATAAVLAAAAMTFAVWRLLRARNMEIWIGSYLRRPIPRVTGQPVHVMFCFVDHFEPMWHGADLDTQRARVDRWCRDYRKLASAHRYADCIPPHHTSFYPD